MVAGSGFRIKMEKPIQEVMYVYRTNMPSWLYEKIIIELYGRKASIDTTILSGLIKLHYVADPRDCLGSIERPLIRESISILGFKIRFKK